MALRPAPNFSSILETTIDSIERPKPLPIGTYTCIIQGQPEYGESQQKKTPFVRFNLAILAAGEDVDQEELDAIGGVTDKVIKDTYYLTPDALWRLQEFLANAGVPKDSTLSLRQAIEEVTNQQLLVVIGHEASQDGKSIFSRVKTTMPIE